MKKKIFLRCLVGAPIGLSISYLITILISIAIKDGNFYPVVPELIQNCGNEINAVILQTLLSVIYGAAFGGASVIWEKENWSLLKQTVLHLIICSAATFPIAYFTHWMSHDLKGIISYFGSFFGIYLIIWFSNYIFIKKKIAEMNKKIK